MFYPKLKSVPVKAYKTNSFGGLVHSSFVPENCFYDMENLTSERFPLLSVREKRGLWTGVFNAGGVSASINTLTYVNDGITALSKAGGKICCCADSEVTFDGRTITDVNFSPDVKVRTIVPFGKNVFIAPDGLYIKALDEDYTIINCNHKVTTADTVSLSFCLSDGTSVSPDFSGSFPKTASAGQTLVMYSENYMELYEYSGSEWIQKGTLFVKLSLNEKIKNFSKGDTVFIETSGKLIPDGAYYIHALADSFFVLNGCLKKAGNTGKLTVERRIPLMDFAVEHNNRIFACRYGKNREGEFVNEIYASALGDPTKWYSFEGISTDSYIASLGCSGEFTGVAVLGNEVLFFKDEYIIRVTGSSPSDFSVFSFPARGVEKGAHLSIVNLNEKVFYKSRSGITVYDGALPVNISEVLGNEHYTDAVAGGVLGKYYIAMTDQKQNRSIYVYDTKTGLWHKEDDNYPTKYMVNLQGCLYFVKLVNSDIYEGTPRKQYSYYIHDSEKATEAINIFGVSSQYFEYEYLPEEDFSWFAETGKLGENINPEKQYLRRLSLTLSLEKGAHFSLYILPDNEHEWKKLCFIDTPHDGVFTVPVSTVPCHSFRLRIEGKGGFTLYSITRHCEISSEVRELG